MHCYIMYTLPTKDRFYLKTTSNMKHDQIKEMNQLQPTKQLRNGPSKPRHNVSQHPFPILGNSLTWQLSKLENGVKTGELGKTLGLNTNTRALDMASSLDQTTRERRGSRWAFSPFLGHEYETRNKKEGWPELSGHELGERVVTEREGREAWKERESGVREREGFTWGFFLSLSLFLFIGKMAWGSMR